MMAAIYGGLSFSAEYSVEDGQSLYSTIMPTLIERYGVYEMELQIENDSMQARNNLLKDMNAVLATLRTNRPNNDGTINPYGTFTNSRGMSQDVFDWMVANGIGIEKSGDKAGVQADFDAAINNLKAAIDTVNSDGQMAMIHFQDTYGKCNQEAELMSNFLSKDQKTSELIIANIR